MEMKQQILERFASPDIEIFETESGHGIKFNLMWKDEEVYCVVTPLRIVFNNTFSRDHKWTDEEAAVLRKKVHRLLIKKIYGI